MHSLRDIRRRIRSISSTAQITRAMQMVAASKMQKAQEAALAGRPFARLLYRIQREATRVGAIDHRLLEVREVKRRAVILVSADKGLCGALNGNVFRLAGQHDIATTLFITAGKRAAQWVAGTGRQLVADFEYGDSPTYPQARAIASFARDLFLKGEVDHVHVIATRYVNTLTQDAMSIDFLPVGEIKGLDLGEALPEELPQGVEDCQFEPSPKDVLGFMLEHYVNFYVYQVLLNAKASEHSARMVSMKNATDNASELISDLTLEYNKLRQGSITTELLEIAGGQSE